MDKRILTKSARDEYSVERLINKEIQLIRQIKNTQSNLRKKRYKMDRKLREVTNERDACFSKLTSGIKASQKPKTYGMYRSYDSVNDLSRIENITTES